jgi:UDP-glucose 4-epimerase
MSCYLVTGGAGFIGSHIAERLVSDGEEVRVLDDFSTGKRENITDFLDHITLYQGDICSRDLVDEAANGADYILHQAALPSVVRSVKNPLRTHQVIVDGTLNVLLAAREHNVKRVVFASSSSVYGDSPTLPKVETQALGPLSPYAAAKASAEHYCQVFHEVYGLPTVTLRYFNVFGPRQDAESPYTGVIAIFARSLILGETPTIDGDGEQSRDFTYVANVVEGNLLAARSDAADGKVLNVACGKRTTINQLYQAMEELLGKRIPAEHGPPRKGDVRHSQADVALARRLLGYEPRVSFEEGLKRTLDWYASILK